MKTVQHKFVEFIPQQLEEGILYVSIEYCTVIHNCVCGCGNKVVTPISPTDWKLTFDGKSITLYPSVGNWSFNCKSHYWITNNVVEFAEKWDSNRINANRRYSKKEKEEAYNDSESLKADILTPIIETAQELEVPQSFWKKLLKYLGIRS